MRKGTLLLLILSIFLTSCVAIFVAGAAGGAVVYDRRSLMSMEKDARIFYVLRKALVTDPRFRNSRIVVSSFNQIVLLAGQTPAASSRVFAEKVARSIPSVRRVYNEMTIDYPISFSQIGEDSFITAQIRSRMLTKKGWSQAQFISLQKWNCLSNGYRNA